MSLTTTDKQDIKVMIRDGIAHLPTVDFVHSEINRLEGIIKVTNTNLSQLATDTKADVNRVELLTEDTNVTIKQMLGMLSDNLKVKTQVNDH